MAVPPTPPMTPPPTPPRMGQPPAGMAPVRGPAQGPPMPPPPPPGGPPAPNDGAQSPDAILAELPEPKTGAYKEEALTRLSDAVLEMWPMLAEVAKLPEAPKTLVPPDYESGKLPAMLAVPAILFARLGAEVTGNKRYEPVVSDLATDQGVRQLAAMLVMLAKDKAFIKAVEAEGEGDMGEEDTSEEEMPGPKEAPPMPKSVRGAMSGA